MVEARSSFGFGQSIWLLSIDLSCEVVFGGVYRSKLIKNHEMTRKAEKYLSRTRDSHQVEITLSSAHESPVHHLGNFNFKKHFSRINVISVWTPQQTSIKAFNKPLCSASASINHKYSTFNHEPENENILRILAIVGLKDCNWSSLHNTAIMNGLSWAFMGNKADSSCCRCRYVNETLFQGTPDREFSSLLVSSRRIQR